MAQQATFGDTAFEVEIIAMTQELLTSGEIEQIIRRELLKGFERGIESAFQWGDLKKAIDKRITDTMVPYIEQYDMSSHLLKLDEILAELVETSAIGGHRKLLENFRTIMREPENPVITLEELFKRYCKHVEEDVDTSKLEVDTDDEPTYEYVTALAEIVPDDRPWRFDSSYKTAMLYLHIEDSEDLHYAIRLSKFSWDTCAACAASTTTRRNRPRPAASARSALNAERSETTSSRRCATSATRRNATASMPSSRRRGGKLRARFPFRSTTAKNSIAT